MLSGFDFGLVFSFGSLVLYSAPRGFSLGSPVFTSHQRPAVDLISLDFKLLNWQISCVGLFLIQFETSQ